MRYIEILESLHTRSHNLFSIVQYNSSVSWVSNLYDEFMQDLIYQKKCKWVQGNVVI